MRWSRGDRAVRVGGSVVVGILVAWLAGSAWGFARARADASLVEREYARLVGRAVYPSAENLRALEDERDALAFMLSELDVSMNAEASIEGAPDAAVFSARAQAAIERYQARLAERAIDVPDDVEVGFAAYASGGAVPEVRNVPRLTRQLDAIERVLDVLLEAGVSSIDELERNRFEFSATPPQQAGAADGERVRVAFTTDEAGVWRALELFAQPARLLEIVEISHQTQSDILSYEVSERRTPELDVSDHEMVSGAAARSRSERIVAGKESIRVELVLMARRMDGSAP